MPAKVIALSGDGIGPEIMEPTFDVVWAVKPDIEFEKRLIGGASIDVDGEPLTDDTLQACREADAVLLAAVGGPKWETEDPSKPRPEQGLLALRKGLGVYANLRPVKPLPALYNASPLRPERLEGADFLIVRELTGGIYFGDKIETEDEGTDIGTYTRPEVERVARVAFEAANVKVTSVDKANVLAGSRIWRRVVQEVHDREFPHIELEHSLIDSTVMKMGFEPQEFDVILADNMFGDVLSDESALLTGSIGNLPSASLGDPGSPGVFEPVHGSAPDIAGQNRANPLAMFLSAAMMLRYGLNCEQEAEAIKKAVEGAVADGLRTPDLGGTANIDEATQAVLARIP